MSESFIIDIVGPISALFGVGKTMKHNIEI
jgi:hypothetical protein